MKPRPRSLRRVVGTVARVGVLWVLDALALWGLAAALPGIDVPSLRAALLVTAILAIFNALVWPLLTRVAMHLPVLVFALGSIVTSTFVIWGVISLVDDSNPTFFGALACGVGLAVVSILVTPLDFDGDAANLRAVRHRMRAARARNRTDVPGVVMFEIDGLAEPVLRRALAEGRAPNMTRWLEQGSHHIVPWECDLSSQTGASQAGLLLGSNHDMPAFRWYEKESGQVVCSNHPPDAAEIEHRRSDGGGLLAVEGTSRGNLVSGDAPRCSATMSTIRDHDRSRPGEFFAFFVDPYALARTLLLFFVDAGREVLAARRQRRRGEEHVNRGGYYPFARAAITVAMRDLNVATLLGDVVEGVPVTYSTFVGYDEVAHHSGITQPDAFAVLERHDHQLARLEQALEQAPRPYHLVVLSDHGQTQGAPFRQRHGLTLEELVRGAIDGTVDAPPATAEAWGEIGAALSEAREDDSMAGRMLARATSGSVAGGTVALGPERDAIERQESLESGAPPDVVVLASGCLGLVSFPGESGRMTLEQIEAAHPRLVETLAGHPGIGFVMVRSEAEGAVVLGAAGKRRLSDDIVEGEDPLAPFEANAADHLRRHDGFPHCPDLLVNGQYHPETDETEPFEDFMGSHGGMGGSQMHPFALVPSEWEAPSEPIVGVEAMHHVLRGWIAQTGLELRPHGGGGESGS